MAIVYEWVVEEVDDYGDIEDCYFFPSYTEAKLFASIYCNQPAIALCKSRSNKQKDSVEDSTYAYVQRGQLADRFEDGSSVPQKYKDQVK